MKILIIGGTRCVGRHFVRAALARGHELTFFNRGKHTPPGNTDFQVKPKPPAVSVCVSEA